MTSHRLTSEQNVEHICHGKKQNIVLEMAEGITKFSTHSQEYNDPAGRWSRLYLNNSWNKVCLTFKNDSYGWPYSVEDCGEQLCGQRIEQIQEAKPEPRKRLRLPPNLRHLFDFKLNLRIVYHWIWLLRPMIQDGRNVQSSCTTGC
jgi:hypothetical protein